MGHPKIKPLTEGRMSKGGHNSPEPSTPRPAAPGGSGGTMTFNELCKQHEVTTEERDSLRQYFKFLRMTKLFDWFNNYKVYDP